MKKLASVLETTAGYLLGETQERELLKDSSMLKRLNDISKFSQKDKEHILYTLDAMINNVWFYPYFNGYRNILMLLFVLTFDTYLASPS